jgi:UDP-N-acetylglucosamine 2-epimerase (hydrolysing)
VFPSVRFEFMIALLEHARFVLGNSSMGIREAPFFGTPTIDVGSRQQGRSTNPHILHVPGSHGPILEAIRSVAGRRMPPVREFGDGRADARFRALLESGVPWALPVQKRFVDQRP